MSGEFTNHLWQSTWFAVVAGLLTVALRKNRAQVRYWLWLSASCKFLVPFALLMSLGSHWQWAPAAESVTVPAVSIAMLQVAEPFPEGLPSVPGAPDTVAWPLMAMLGVWALGFAAVALTRLRGWLHVRAAVRASTPLDIPAPVEIRSAPGLLEPGVVGLLRPILLVPAGIQERLTPPQLEAVLAHELCHVRRRDNLTSAIHMFVEAIFWFHPLVWWIGARLVEERERACDEEVLRAFGAPRAYAEGILNICKLYVESPLACVSGVTGADLKKRIEAIMSNHTGIGLNLRKKLLLAAAGVLAASAPLFVGLVKAQSEAPLAFEVASVKQHDIPFGFVRRAESSTIECSGVGNCGIFGNRFTEEKASLKDLIMDAYKVKRFQIASLPSWGDTGRDVYDIAAKVEGNRTPTLDQARRMLQTLLADRFQLQVHHETRELPVYALVVGKSGSKLTTPKPGQACNAGAGGEGGGMGGGRKGGGGGAPRNDETEAFLSSWERMASLLSAVADRPVIDQTGLQGPHCTPEGNSPFLAVLMTARGLNADDAPAEASVFALLQRWGLKLEAQKGPVDMLVIDHVERPSGN